MSQGKSSGSDRVFRTVIGGPSKDREVPSQPPNTRHSELDATFASASVVVVVVSASSCGASCSGAASPPILSSLDVRFF